MELSTPTTDRTCPACGEPARARFKQEAGHRKMWLDCAGEGCRFGYEIGTHTYRIDEDEDGAAIARREWDKTHALQTRTGETLYLGPNGQGMGDMILYDPDAPEDERFLNPISGEAELGEIARYRLEYCRSWGNAGSLSIEGIHDRLDGEWEARYILYREQA